MKIILNKNELEKIFEGEPEFECFIRALITIRDVCDTKIIMELENGQKLTGALTGSCSTCSHFNVHSMTCNLHDIFTWPEFICKHYKGRSERK